MVARLVYMTCSSEEEARRIGRTLVEERLAACANVVAGMRSCYWWQGEVQEDEEAVLIAKTRAALVDRLSARVKELHSSDVPCIVALALDGGNPDFLKWIEDQTV